jgi:hypothetical protein
MKSNHHGITDGEAVEPFNNLSAVAEPPVSAMAIGTGGKEIKECVLVPTKPEGLELSRN